jgi:hypothetical protein
LYKAIRRHEANMPDSKHSRTYDKIVFDQHVAEKAENNSRRHTDIEFLIIRLIYQRINKVNYSEQSEQRTTHALKRKVEAVALVKVVQHKKSGNDNDIDSQQ